MNEFSIRINLKIKFNSIEKVNNTIKPMIVLKSNRKL